MKASSARHIAKVYSDKMGQANTREYHRIMAELARNAKILWDKRGPQLINQIDGWIMKAASKGLHNIWEPTEINPNGDSIFYLEKSDWPVYELLMQYYKDQGFKVEDYQYHCMKITW